MAALGEPTGENMDSVQDSAGRREYFVEVRAKALRNGRLCAVLAVLVLGYTLPS